MKRQLVIALTTLGLVIMLTDATTSAQSSILLKVNIPFEFSVGASSFLRAYTQLPMDLEVCSLLEA